MRWLIAEDDRALASFLSRALPAAGDSVEVAGNGPEALAFFEREEPDLLILDLDLPLIPGGEVLRTVRALSPLCPVLVVSGHADDETRIACLNEGADDCLQKPFSLGELRARCAAVLRRRQMFDHQLAAENKKAASGGEPVLQHGSLEVERLGRRVHVAGEPLHLTNREFALLEHLMQSGNRPVSRTEIREHLWGSDAAVEASVVDVHLGALRRKLAAYAESPRIETVRGAGFCLRPPSPAFPPPPNLLRPSASLSGGLHG